MRVLNTQQMREADRRTIDEIGIPAIVLMENAGRQAVAAMEAAFDDLATSHVGVLCGRGNNGGDGFVIARTLVQRGVETSVFLLGSVADVRGDRTGLRPIGHFPPQPFDRQFDDAGGAGLRSVFRTPSRAISRFDLGLTSCGLRGAS